MIIITIIIVILNCQLYTFVAKTIHIVIIIIIIAVIIIIYNYSYKYQTFFSQCRIFCNVKRYFINRESRKFRKFRKTIALFNKFICNFSVNLKMFKYTWNFQIYMETLFLYLF